MPHPSASELKDLPLFASLSGVDRALLAANLEVRAVAAGTTLIEEGQTNDAFFVLRDGEVGVARTPSTMYVLSRTQYQACSTTPTLSSW